MPEAAYIVLFYTVEGRSILMKRIRKSLVFMLAFLMLVITPVSLSGSHEAFAAETGWVKRGGKIYYYDASGTMAVGKKIINGKLFFFAKKRAIRGSMRTGIVKIGGVEHFFKKSGGLGVVGSGAEGWTNIKGRGLCYCSNGVIVKKSIIQDYYVNKNGSMTASSRKLYKLVRQTVNKLVTNAMTKEQKLRTCYKYLCSSVFKYVTKRPFSYKKDWRVTYGYEMFTTHSGVCYNFAAAFAYMARFIGYKDVKAIAGELLYLDGHWDLHSWTKILMGNTWYVFDSSMEHGGMGDFWKKTYAGTGRKYREWTSGQYSYLNA